MISDYYLSIPNPLIYPYYSLFANQQNSCPFFAPPIAGAQCRFCSRYRYNHQKYYLYSNYARTIQMAWLRRQFRQFCVGLRKKYPHLVRAPGVLIRFKMLYHRRWTETRYLAFLRCREYVWNRKRFYEDKTKTDHGTIVGLLYQLHEDRRRSKAAARKRHCTHGRYIIQRNVLLCLVHLFVSCVSHHHYFSELVSVVAYVVAIGHKDWLNVTKKWLMDSWRTKNKNL